jgi:hypothetical protein
MYDPNTTPGQPPITPLRRPEAPVLPPPVPQRRPRFTPKQEAKKYRKFVHLSFGLFTIVAAVYGSPMAFVFGYCWIMLLVGPVILKRLWHRWEEWLDDRPAERAEDGSQPPG